MTSILQQIPPSSSLFPYVWLSLVCQPPLRIRAKSTLCRRQAIDTLLLLLLSPPSRIHIAKPFSLSLRLSILYLVTNMHWLEGELSVMRQMFSSTRIHVTAGDTGPVLRAPSGILKHAYHPHHKPYIRVRSANFDWELDNFISVTFPIMEQKLFRLKVDVHCARTR